MGIDSTLNITPEESQIEHNIQATLRRNVDQTKLQQTPEKSEQRAVVDQPSAAALDWAAETPNSSAEAMPKRTPTPFFYDVPRIGNLGNPDSHFQTYKKQLDSRTVQPLEFSHQPNLSQTWRTCGRQQRRLSGIFSKPRRVQRAREECQDGVLKSVRHFFAPVDYNEAVRGEWEQAE